MLFSRRIPTWVKNFPIAIDRETLTQLAKASKGPLDHPREMNFAIYGFSQGPDLEAAKSKMEEQGWRPIVSEQDGAPGKFVVDATKDDYVITEESYRHDTIFFNRLAEMYGARYDGWYASS